MKKLKGKEIFKDVQNTTKGHGYLGSFIGTDELEFILEKCQEWKKLDINLRLHWTSLGLPTVPRCYSILYTPPVQGPFLWEQPQHLTPAKT